MQAAYVRLLRKIKQKSDGESAIAKDLVQEGIEKFLDHHGTEPGIIEASRKLYSTAIKTYRIATPLIGEIARTGAQFLLDKFGNTACNEIYYIFSSAIIQYFQLKDEKLAETVADHATSFFNEHGCSDQAQQIADVLNDPKSKSDVKFF